MSNCSVTGCTRHTRSRGAELCNTHYFRVRRTGSTGPAEIWNRVRPGCSVNGCSAPHIAHGYCLNHMRHVAKGGHVDHVGTPPRGRTNTAWLGESIAYNGAHQRVRAARGPATDNLCACGQPAKQWSYLFTDPNERVDEQTGLTYGPDPAHYAARCAPCHKRLDLHRLRQEAGHRSRVVAHTCAQCGEEFLAAPNAKRKRKYCSQPCYQAAPRVKDITPNGVCLQCGVAFRGRSGQENKYCGQTCYHAARRELRKRTVA
jgi:hypothetical protein